jgi:hypothetical protein
VRLRSLLPYTLIGLVLAVPATADDEYRIVLENHRFSPAEVVVPAGRKFRLVIENRDDAEEEFESYDLNRERLVPARGTITLYLGPLAPGEYGFFGEFNLATAGGTLVAR